MTANRQILRVIMKLMAVTGLALFAYAFVSGLWVNDPASNSTVPLELDLNDMQPGDIKEFKLGRHALLVLFRTVEMKQRINQQDLSHLLAPGSTRNLASTMDRRYRSLNKDYFVVIAIDPFYGCDIEFNGELFSAVCVDARYDLAGRAFKQTQAQANLIVPEYSLSEGRLQLWAQ